MFYTYDQNNSGGSFNFNAESGVSHYVIIEADSDEQANDRAESIGLYFNGVEDGLDCECCGSRWYSPQEATSIPSNYGEPINLDKSFTEAHAAVRYSKKWMKDKPEGFVHYLDGRIIPFWN
jgi:hypothetical protein